ncbi:hypothetical protein XENTR_v10015156 [Xenopus tropicalis]|nr:hypothetical protein XENTR_v10015156 [Xenopus tropicalis]
MAMLAEPRRKQKWSVDPRNSAWSKDESKFGQKMLEKMGWSKGKGLGAKEQGSTDHIKVQVKNNTLGLGASINYEDNWLSHQDDFNQILAELNNCHGTESEETPAEQEKKSFSLEEKSKSSRKRVHYMKFAKGKDLSCRSATDLACIFGKREKAKKGAPLQEEASVESEGNEEEETGKQSPSIETPPGNTVTSSLSVNEYFAKRMAELKRSQSKRTEQLTQEEEVLNEEEPDESSTERNQKPNKRKRNKGDAIQSSGDPEPDMENTDSPCVTERPQSKKKSKNKKYQETENETGGTKDEEDEEEKPKKRKKKNKKRKDEPHGEEEEELDSHTQPAKKKKKKKKSE